MVVMMNTQVRPSHEHTWGLLVAKCSGLQIIISIGDTSLFGSQLGAQQSSQMPSVHQQAWSFHSSTCSSMPGLAGSSRPQANGSAAATDAAGPASHQEPSSDDGEGSGSDGNEDSGGNDGGPSQKRARLTPGALVPDSEQLRLDIGICVKGPEGSEIIEVGPCWIQARHAATDVLSLQIRMMLDSCQPEMPVCGRREHACGVERSDLRGCASCLLPGHSSFHVTPFSAPLALAAPSFGPSRCAPALDSSAVVCQPCHLSCVQIIAARPLQAGQEIFNTYGELGNADLVAKYGFALPDNPFDKLTLDKTALLELVCDLLSKKALAQRCNFLERQR